MIGIRKGSDMHMYTTGPCKDVVEWRFPEGFEGVDDDTYYQVVYDYYSASDPCDFSAIYHVTYCVPISEQVVCAYDIVKKFDNITDIKDFEKWLDANYEIKKKA